LPAGGMDREGALPDLLESGARSGGNDLVAVPTQPRRDPLSQACFVQKDQPAEGLPEAGLARHLLPGWNPEPVREAGRGTGRRRRGFRRVLRWLDPVALALDGIGRQRRFEAALAAVEAGPVH